jgi:hypothetical protein
MDDSGEDSDEVENDDDDEDDRISDEEIEYMEMFMRTFHNGDYDNEFDDKLSFDRSVIEPVRITQISYNKPDDWVERNRIGLERVTAQFPTRSRWVHNSCFELYLSHNNYGHQLMDNEYPIVWHEPVLDRSWDQLEYEIDQRKQLGDIHILNVEITKESMAALVAILSTGRANSSSTTFRFNNTNLCAEGIISISKLIDFSSRLDTLIIYHNRIDCIDSARCLSRSLKSHTRIRELQLAHCDLGSTTDILSVILQSNISIINLEHNNIDSFGAVTIAKYLESDPPILRIDLDHNRLNDDDAILISQALKRNTNLRQIYLHSNNLTWIGVKALLTCVFDSSSLNALSESNHTLLGMDFFDDNNRPFSKGANCISRLLHLDRTQKILFVLQDKDSLLQYLANVPVELIPEVLAYPHGRVDNEHQHKQLNVLYSTMRWWNMPMLYSYHQDCVKSDTKRKRNE